MKPATEADFLDLWRSVLPRFYTAPIENEGDGRGLDVPTLQAAIMARLERAANVNQQAYYLRPHSTQTGEIARSAARARGTVRFTRVGSVAAELRIPSQTILEAEQLGPTGETVSLGRYLTTTETVMESGFAGPESVVIEAEHPGYHGNLDYPGQVVRFAALGRAQVRAVATQTTTLLRNVDDAADQDWDRFTPESLGRYVRLVQIGLPLVTTSEPRRVVGLLQASGQVIGIRLDPPLAAGDIGKPLSVEFEEWADVGLVVSQPTPITGGRGDGLGAIGSDRGVARVTGETDDQYADRIMYAPDTISPAAIERTVDAILGPLGIEWCLRETADLDTLMGFTFDVHPWDLEGLPTVEKVVGSELVGQGFVWLGTRTARRFFLICVKRSQLGDFGFGYDVLTNPISAWDLAAFDGWALGFGRAIARVHSAVNAARAAGVGFRISLDCC
jgi:hypothetical protein